MEYSLEQKWQADSRSGCAVFWKQLRGQKAMYSGVLASSTVLVDPPPCSVQDLTHLTHWRQLALTTVNRKPIATEKFLETELGTVLGKRSNLKPLITWGLKPRSISVRIHVPVRHWVLFFVCYAANQMMESISASLRLLPRHPPFYNDM